MSYVLPPPRVPAVPVAGGEAGAQFPVHRIYCVGRNYVDHAIEMGHSGREPPFFFMKPADAVLPVAEGEVGQMHYPSLTRDLHHEVELVVAIGKGGRNIRAADATSHVWGYAVGLDMTRRDLQGEAKKLGRPVVHRQGLRRVGAHRADPPGGAVLCECRHPHCARRERRGAPAQRHRQADLERARDHRAALAWPGSWRRAT